jgi:hypothetical protein
VAGGDRGRGRRHRRRSLRPLRGSEAQQLCEEPARHEAKPSPWATHDSCWTLKAHGVVVKLYLILRQARPHHSTRVSIPDRTGLTAGLRYRFTGPVRPDTGRNRTKGSLNLFEFKSRCSNGTDRYTGRTVRLTGRFDRYTGDVGGAARTGKPVGYTGKPVGYTGIPAGWTGIPVSFPPLQK